MLQQRNSSFPYTFKYRQQPFIIKPQATKTNNTDKLTHSVGSHQKTYPNRTLVQNQLRKRYNYTDGSHFNNRSCSSALNTSNIQAQVQNKRLIAQIQPKKKYLTNQDINLKQISVKIQNILSRLQQEQKKSVCNESTSIKSRQFSPISQISPAFVSTVSKLRNRQKQNYHQKNSYSNQKDLSVRSYVPPVPGNIQSHKQMHYVRPTQNHKREVYTSQILQRCAINKDQMQSQVLSLKQERRISQAGYRQKNYSNLQEKYNRVKQRSKVPQSFTQNNFYRKSYLKINDKSSIKSFCKDTDGQLKVAIKKNQFPKDYPKNYNDVKLRYKTQPNQEPHFGFGQHKHRRMTTEPENLNRKQHKFNYSIHQTHQIPQKSCCFSYQSNVEKPTVTAVKNIQEIRSKYKKTPNPTPVPAPVLAPAPMKTVQNSIIEIPQLKLKNGKDINQAINQIQIRIQRCNTIKDSIITKKQYQSTRIRNSKENNPIKTVKKQINQTNSIVMQQIGNLKQDDQQKTAFKIKTTPFTSEKGDQQNQCKRSYRNPRETSKKQEKAQNGQTSKLINALNTQVKLDCAFRKAKNWIASWNDRKKWQKLHQHFKQRGITYFTESDLRKVYEVKQQENDPFYSFRDDNQTIQSLTNKYLSSQQHWIRNIYRKFNYENLLREGFIQKVESATCSDNENPQFNINNPKANIMFTVSSLIRLLNFQFEEFYRVRDVFIIYERLSKGRPLTLRQFLGEISKNQQY